MELFGQPESDWIQSPNAVALASRRAPALRAGNQEQQLRESEAQAHTGSCFISCESRGFPNGSRFRILAQVDDRLQDASMRYQGCRHFLIERSPQPILRSRRVAR